MFMFMKQHSHCFHCRPRNFGHLPLADQTFRKRHRAQILWLFRWSYWAVPRVVVDLDVSRGPSFCWWGCPTTCNNMDGKER